MKKEFMRKLMDAIEDKDEARVKDILSQYRFGYILEEDPFDNHVILCEAIQTESQSLIQVLLDHGADLREPRFPPVYGTLGCAIQMTTRESKMLEFLLNKGADVNELRDLLTVALHCTWLVVLDRWKMRSF